MSWLPGGGTGLRPRGGARGAGPACPQLGARRPCPAPTLSRRGLGVSPSAASSTVRCPAAQVPFPGQSFGAYSVDVPKDPCPALA